MFRDDLRASVQAFPVYQRQRGLRAFMRQRFGRSGERPPYTFILGTVAAIGLYCLQPLSVEHVPVPLAEILRDGGSPVAAWRQPETAALLSGQACIPMSRLLENRPMGVEHSYARPVACDS